MSLSQTMLLGFIAGVTILLGLPIGRLRKPAPACACCSTRSPSASCCSWSGTCCRPPGSPSTPSCRRIHEGGGGFGGVAGYGVLFAGGPGVGLLGLVAYEGWMRGARRPRESRTDPGAMAAAEVHGTARPVARGPRPGSSPC